MSGSGTSELAPTTLSVRRAPARVTLVFIAAVAIVAAYFVSTLPGMPGRPGTIPFWETWVRSAAYAGAAVLCSARAILVRADRRAWAAMSAALLSYTAGYVSFGIVYADEANVPYISFADALWLAFYPLSYVALISLVRSRARRFHRSTWLDGLVAALAAAAFSAAVVYGVLIRSADGESLVVAVNLAYPIADLLLIATVVCVFGVTGWRPGRAWLLLGLGLLGKCFADGVYLVQAAADTYVQGTWLDAVWPCAFLVIALAAWQPEPDRGRRAGEWRVLAVPSVSTIVAVGVLLWSALGERHPIAAVLASAAVLLSVARTALTFREVRQLAETRRQALTDDLTGLPNRRALGRRIEAELAAGRPTALLLIDLDGFKELNDTLGHQVGDLLLEQLGARLAASAGSDFLARLGGDEFALVQSGCADVASATRAGERMRESLEEPFVLDDIPMQIDASVGLALFPEHAATDVELLKLADIAMYQAKRDRSGISAYREERDEHSRDRLLLLGELRAGIPRGELAVHYQPQVDIATGELSGLEALVRWEHPVHGRLMPPAFLPAVEQTSLMRPFTERVIGDALERAAAWAGGPLDVPIAVNVAAANLLDNTFPDTVDRLLRAAGIPADRLCIEVTENAVMTDAERTVTVLARLRDLGVRVSIDDFGTGHSSLARLKHLPVDELKIDKDFVFHMDTDDRDAAIVEAAVTLARRLDLSVVAEGVETPAAWRRLAELGCDHAQGFLVSRPLAPADLEAWSAAGGPAEMADAAAV